MLWERIDWMIHDLGQGLYFIAKKETNEHIHCNAYLLVEGENAVLVEPGNILDFDVILEDVKSIIDIKKIKKKCMKFLIYYIT